MYIWDKENWKKKSAQNMKPLGKEKSVGGLCYQH